MPRVARSEPNSSRNIDLPDEGGRYMFARTISRDFEANIYQLEFERWVGNGMITRWNVDWVTVDDSKATSPGLVGIFSGEHVWFDSRVVRGRFWSPEGHPFWSTFQLVPGWTRSWSAIRLWSNGALLTADLVFSIPNVRLDRRWRAGVDLDSPNDQEQ